MHSTTQSRPVEVTGESIHPCVVQIPPAWQPLSRAQVLMMAIELRRIRRSTKQTCLILGEES